MKLNKLSPEERAVIEGEGTETPFSGVYNDFFKEGVYVCRRCENPLYSSSAKFNSGCGWPAFDYQISGSVKRISDSDGRRIEITCAKCSAHLGHVFEGEKLTNKDIRHCVNSLSIKFIPKHEN